MIVLDKLFLLRFQLYFCYLWNLSLNFLNNYRIQITSLIGLFLSVNFNLFADNYYLKLILIVSIVIINLVTLQIIKVKYNQLTLFSFRKCFEENLKFKENEITSFFDTNYEKFSKEKSNFTTEVLWARFKKQIALNIKKNFSFKFKYFFYTTVLIERLTLLNIFLFLYLAFNFDNISLYKINNFLKFEDEIYKNRDVSTNIWIYPPIDSEKKIIFYDQDTEFKTKKNQLLVEKGSKILVKVFGAPEKFLKVKVFEKSKIRSLKKIDFFENTTTFETQLTSGEYKIFFRDKLLNSIDIRIDEKPKINFLNDILIKEELVSFDYSFKDENNEITLLQISSNKSLSKDHSKPNLKQINRLSEKPNSYINLSTENQLENEKKKFSMKLSNHPLAGKKVYIKLKSYDLNNNYGESGFREIILPKKKFKNKYSLKIISIRDQFYKDENIFALRQSLKEFVNQIDNSIDFVKSPMLNLLNYLNSKEILKEIKFDKAISELFRVADLLEEYNKDSIREKILELKDELRKLIEKNASDNELQRLISKIENYIEMLEKKSNQLINDENIENEKNSLPKKNTMLEKAQNLINRIDSLLSERKKSELDAKQATMTLKKFFIDQTKLLDETFNQLNKKSLSKSLSEKQLRIYKKFLEKRKNILDILPDEIKNLDQLEFELKKSEEELTKNNFKESLVHQKKVLNLIKNLTKKIKENSIEEYKKNPNPKNEKNDEEMKYDIPIVFEKNQFDKILEEIRRLINKGDKSEREKKYLKELLPKF